MGKRVCTVLNCRNRLESTKKRNKELGIKNKSLFKAPKDKNLLDRWTAILGQLKRPLTEYCFVCEEHFSIDDVFHSNDILLNDGTVHHTKKIVLKLRPNAIPIVAENLTGDDCDDINMEVPSLFNNVTPQRNDNCEQAVESSTAENINQTPEKLNFEMSISTYSNILLPSCSWGAIKSENEKSITFLTVDKNEVLRRFKI
ncbi:PREDICTED: uncharacterized protein LOC108771863 [Cyphomyrmex costatus]|uniref:uncharacterized protein LOC108771863 n=1 Tax=Cyphomyrmex costatus TaxID=456900 RepID=UPI0008524335|nr:PREDICTED: uncharacterized protein LOC108771863 [Cyphomyrmex costatus]